jgi:hypothetical protein
MRNIIVPPREPRKDLGENALPENVSAKWKHFGDQMKRGGMTLSELTKQSLEADCRTSL